MNLDKVVRPFQVTEIFNARSITPDAQPPPVGAPSDPAVLKWGSNADSTVLDDDNPVWGIAVQVEWREDKSRRVTNKVRIENPDDSDQFVEVERIKRAVFVNTMTRQEM